MIVKVVMDYLLFAVWALLFYCFITRLQSLEWSSFHATSSKTAACSSP